VGGKNHVGNRIEIKNLFRMIASQVWVERIMLVMRIEVKELINPRLELSEAKRARSWNRLEGE